MTAEKNASSSMTNGEAEFDVCVRCREEGEKIGTLMRK